MLTYSHTNLVCSYRLEQDIGFGKNSNFQTLCVLYGAMTEAKLLSHPNPSEIPDFYLPCFADFAKVLADLTVRDATAATKL